MCSSNLNEFKIMNLLIFIHFLLISFTLNCLIKCGSTTFLSTESNLDCLKATNCSECIKISNCAWCLFESFDSITGRKCDYYDTLLKDGCPLASIYNPTNKIEIIEELIRSNEMDKLDKSIDQDDKLVQLKPDKIKLKIRPNTKLRFNLTFDQAEKYPLDIYYLMDLTYSMKDHRDSLILLADKISESMSNITTKFRLGFGSFVDKVVMPYSNMLPQKLKNPCNSNLHCVAAYGFRNHLSLTNDSKLFLEKVKDAQLSGNLDNAEGSFDALIQAINCKEEINWHYPSRKIILLATDSLFHYAGDGKLGGIVKPNDGQCHLDKNGYYTESLTTDYPSLEQINKAIVSNQMNIIFSVPDNALDVYEKLSENLEGTITAKLESNSSNIVDLIRENYEKIVSTIELKDNASKNVELKYFTKCTSTDNSLKRTNLCKDVGVGQKLNFEVEIEVKSCKQSKIENFSIFPLGIEEKTEIELELICDCECDSKIEIKSSYCSFDGNLTCGMCECDPFKFGNNCQCSQKNLTSSIDECRPRDSDEICSSKGSCVCGRCQCDDKTKNDLLIYGKYCQCDNYSCPKSNNNLCNNKGRCCNKKCECISGWSGESCDCPSDESTCISPINNKICSGAEFGECVCGKCQCKRRESGEIYTGRYCNDCPTCYDECPLYDPCVLCKAFNTGPYKSNCKENCNFDIEIVKEFSYLRNGHVNISNVNSNDLQTDDFQPSLIKRCIMIDEENCQYEFIYKFQIDTERIYIEILKDKICPNVHNILIFMFLIIFIIILIGLFALMIWKIYAMYRDEKEAKEWAIYLKTRQLTSSGSNPLYKPPQAEYKNPLYNNPLYGQMDN